MIILEGADNSGKTTLAKQLAESGRSVYSAGPAPKSKEEEIQCLEEQLARCRVKVLHDRVTAISQQVYADRLFDSSLVSYLLRMRTDGAIVVYCRPPERTLMDLSNHQVKSYDTEEHLQKIIDNQHTFIGRYDAIMATVPHVLYDWTDPQMNVNAYRDYILGLEK